MIFHQEAYQQADILRGENEELTSKLSKVERTLAEAKNRVTKLEDDNAKLRRALEHSMTRLNRMSADSDFLVDRLCSLQPYVLIFRSPCGFYSWRFFHTMKTL